MYLYYIYLFTIIQKNNYNKIKSKKVQLGKIKITNKNKITKFNQLLPGHE